MVCKDFDQTPVARRLRALSMMEAYQVSCVYDSLHKGWVSVVQMDGTVYRTEVKESPLEALETIIDEVILGVKGGGN